MASLIKSCLLCIAVILAHCDAYKVLVVFPIPSSSHNILGQGYVQNLLKDGHEVTYITAYPYKPDNPKLRIVDVNENSKIFPTHLINLNAIINNQIPKMDHGGIQDVFLAMANMTLHNENVQKILQDPKEQFDVVVAEWMFTSLPSVYAAIFNCPLIWSSSMDTHWAVQRLVDQPSNPAFTADCMSETLPPFTFKQRVLELYDQLRLLKAYWKLEKLESQEYETTVAPIIRKRGLVVQPYNQVQFNGSLILVNSHVSLGHPAPIPQSMKAIGGYHIDENVKPLPENLKKIMDNAKHGVVYFSMGSNLKSKDIPKELKENLLKMFGQLKQTVLWKFEENLPNTPKNVHILNWAPQASILSHPKTVVFITHGGILSAMESIHFGVPTIGIPAFADQFTNVGRSVYRGYALKVELAWTMATELKLAIEEITTNPKYSAKAKELSMIYHDRPLTPAKELVFWINHVVKTGGAQHLRSPALHVPLYQKLYLDLIAVVLATLFVIVRLLKKVCCKFCSKNKVDNKKKTK